MRHLPSAISLGSLASGFVGVLCALLSLYSLALTSVLVSIVLDSIDGRVARLLRAESRFGAQMDAYADVVAFAMVPGLALYHFLDHRSASILLWFPSILAGLSYTICGVIRLARFNSKDPSPETINYFQGLPMPPLALVILSILALNERIASLAGDALLLYLLLGTVAIGCFLMVSTIPYPSFKTAKSYVLCAAVATAIVMAISSWLVAEGTWPAVVLGPCIVYTACPLGRVVNVGPKCSAAHDNGGRHS